MLTRWLLGHLFVKTTRLVPKTFLLSHPVQSDSNPGKSTWDLTILYTHTPELIVCNKLVIPCTWILRNSWQSSAFPQRPESSTNRSICQSWCKTLAIPTCVRFPADRATPSVLQHFDFTLSTAEAINRAKGQSQQWETQNNTLLFSRDEPQQQDEPSVSDSHNIPNSHCALLQLCLWEWWRSWEEGWG